jgi:hypothetical protein
MVIPVGAEENFEGVIDLIKMKKITFDEASQGQKMIESDIPAELIDEAKKWRHELIEKAAEQDDALLEKYLGEELTNEEVMRAVRKATIARKIVPVLCGTAFKNKGVQMILNAVVDYLPSPLDIPPVICAVEKEANSRMADDAAPVLRHGLQDHVRQAHGQADLRAHLLRHAQARAKPSTTARATAPSAWAACCACTPTSRSRWKGLRGRDRGRGGLRRHQDRRHPVQRRQSHPPDGHHLPGPRGLHQHQAGQPGRQREVERGPVPPGR